MEFQLTNEVIYWRGPSPFHFVQVPAAQSEAIAEVASQVSYGWGVIPVTVQIGKTEFNTSLFPKNGGYLLPLKDAVRKAEKIEVGQGVAARLRIEL